MPEAAGAPELSSEQLVDEPYEPTLISSERVFDGKVWDLRSEVFDYNGGELTRQFVDHTGAVGVLAMDAEDRVLVLQQYRHPVRLRDWELPAGLLDVEGEDPLAAAKRELQEEADLRADTWHLLTQFVPSPGGSSEVIRVYLARDLHAADVAFDREGEEADMVARWVSLDEVVQAALAHRVQNAPLIIAALTAQASRAGGWASLRPADSPWPNQPHRGAVR